MTFDVPELSDVQSGTTMTSGFSDRTLTIKRSDLAALAADPDVEAVLPDHDVAITTSNIVPDYGWLTVLGLNSRTATFPYDGTGIGVAVIDSGITLVNDL